MQPQPQEHMIRVRELTSQGDESVSETVDGVIADIDAGCLVVNDEDGKLVTKRDLKDRKKARKIKRVTKHKPVHGG